MVQFMLFLHVIGAVGMGFYIVLPVLIGRTTQFAGEGQAGMADGLVAGNRIAQYFLVLQLLTGGYLMSQSDYSVLWMVLVTLLFLAIAALGGMMTKPLRRVVESIRSSQSATNHIKRAQTMSVTVLIIYLVIIFLMKYPNLF